MTKQKNKQIRKKYELKKEIDENQDWCYCKEILGLESDVDYKYDQPIDKTKPIDGFPFPNNKGYTLDIYICKRCGKKHTPSISFA